MAALFKIATQPTEPSLPHDLSEDARDFIQSTLTKWVLSLEIGGDEDGRGGWVMGHFWGGVGREAFRTSFTGQDLPSLEFLQGSCLSYSDDARIKSNQILERAHSVWRGL